MGAEVIDQDVKVLDQVPEHLLAPLRSHIESNSSFVQINRVIHPIRIEWTLVNIWVLNPIWDRCTSSSPNIRSLHGLYLNDIRTKTRKDMSGESAGPGLCETQYSYAL